MRYVECAKAEHESASFDTAAPGMLCAFCIVCFLRALVVCIVYCFPTRFTTRFPTRFTTANPSWN